MRNEILIILIMVIMATSVCGCNQQESPINNITTVTPIPSPSYLANNITGIVYINGYATSDVRIEAISTDGIDHRTTTTNDSGIYTLNVLPDTMYNVTAIYQGLRHTIWPVYITDETITYDINLTTTPRSTIEGSGYTMGGPSPNTGMYDHKRWSGVVINLTSAKDNKTITALTDNNGSYSIEVVPNVLYNITGASSLQNKYPIPVFHYRNYAGPNMGYIDNITVGPNETALVDYEIRLP